jgi:hypothetical protein
MARIPDVVDSLPKSGMLAGPLQNLQIPAQAPSRLMWVAYRFLRSKLTRPGIVALAMAMLLHRYRLFAKNFFV